MNSREVFLVFAVRVTGASSTPIACSTGTDIWDIMLILVVDKVLVVVSAHIRMYDKGL